MTDLAQQTLSRVREGLRSGQCASLPEIIKVVHALSANVKELAVQELADLVKNDTVVLEKIIRAAHSIGYNPSGTPIHSITDAIQVIGFDRVRSLSLSLLLLENSRMQQYSQERRKACMQSLMSGLIAQNLASSGDICPAELAFIGAALRGFGRIVLATYTADELRLADEIAKEQGEDRAYREVFGLTPLELGRRLFEASSLSPILMRALDACNPGLYDQQMNSLDTRVLALSDCAFKIAEMASDENMSETEFRAAIKTIAQNSEKLITRLERRLDAVFAETLNHLNSLLRSCGHDALPPRSIRCLQHRLEHTDPPPPPPVPEVIIDTPESIAQKQKEIENEISLGEWEEAAKKMEELVASGTQGVVSARNHLIASFHKGFDASECWLFQQSDQDASTFPLLAGEGAQVAGLKGHARATKFETGVFSVCLKRGENVFILNASDPKLKSHYPAWFRHGVELASFLLLCIRDEQGPIGLIFLGWKNTHEPQLGPEQTRVVRRMMSLYASQQRGRLG